MPHRPADELLRTVVSHAPVVLFAVDAEGIFTLSDGAGLAPLGLAPGQVVGQSAFELYAGVPEIVAHLRRALAGEEHSGEVQVGALHYVARYTPLRDAEGRVSGVVGVATDVTESRRALAALRASEERYRNLYEKTPVMLHSIDPSGRLVSVSDAWCEVLGYTRAEVLGRRSTEFLSEASRGRAEEALQRLFATGGVREAPLQFVRKDGGTVDVLLSATVERDPTGGPLRYLGVLIDVTEQRRMQSRLLQSDRLASLGTLAAGVAHELNNPLTYLLGNLAHLRRLFAHGLPPNLDEVRDLLRTAAEGAERIRGIVDDLRVFTRPEGTRRERVELSSVVASVLQLARSVLRYEVHVAVDLDGAAPVWADEARLAQVFLNLVLNAVQALRASDAPRKEIRIRAHSSAERVSVRVEDTGPGIPPEARERVFEPFYTTKAPGEGSGLGLAIVRGIVEDLGGTVALEEGREGGASFVLSLPRAPVNAPPPATRTQTPPPPSSPKRPLRVLVVDDERAVARSLSLVLEPHAVAVAHSLAEAVSRAREDPFDALVCDLLMPDANGVEVYEAVVAAQPELKDRVVFMTGAVTPDALELPAGRPLLQKPFDIGLLRTLLAELTGDRPQAR